MLSRNKAIFPRFIIRSCSSTKESIRLAQASEIFRSSYFRSNSDKVNISIDDIDELIVTRRVRPSILICALEISAGGLGTISRVLPRVITENLDHAVNDAVLQQLNDCIRTTRTHDSIDLKETLKYHRDLKIIDEKSPTGKSESIYRFNVTTAVILNLLKLSKNM